MTHFSYFSLPIMGDSKSNVGIASILKNLPTVHVYKLYVFNLFHSSIYSKLSLALALHHYIVRFQWLDEVTLWRTDPIVSNLTVC